MELHGLENLPVLTKDIRVLNVPIVEYVTEPL
jgi:hypothetical protein